MRQRKLLKNIWTNPINETFHIEIERRNIDEKKEKYKNIFCGNYDCRNTCVVDWI